jgi:chromosome partitioning protein
LQETLQKLRRARIKLVFIDTPGRADKALSHIVGASDLVVVPVVPSPHDLRAIEQTITMIKDAGVRMVFCVNNAGAGKLTGQAAIVLSQHGTVSPVICKTRQDFRSSMINGLTVRELDAKSKSAGEIAELWTYVASILGEKRHGKAS